MFYRIHKIVVVTKLTRYLTRDLDFQQDPGKTGIVKVFRDITHPSHHSQHVTS